MPCVIKYDHKDGERLSNHEVELWCGKDHNGFIWAFCNAQHAALADKPICNSCRAAIKKALDNK